MTSEFLYTLKSVGSFCHCPSLLKVQSGELLATWYGYPEEEYREAKIILARQSTGQTSSKWQLPEVLLPTSPYSAGNPVLFQEPTGRICLLFVYLKGSYWNDAELQAMYSEDNGKSWTTPLALSLPRGTMVRAAPLEVEGGTLLLPAYDERDKHSMVLASRPPYSAWRVMHRFTDPPLIQPTIVQGRDACLTMYFRATQEPKRIWRSVSPDNGKTWFAPMQTPLPNPLSGIAAVRMNDYTALVYNHTEQHQRYPLSIAITRNYGVSWSQPWHFETAEHEVSYPSFIDDGVGKLHGLFSFNRRMIKYVTCTEQELQDLE